MNIYKSADQDNLSQMNDDDDDEDEIMLSATHQSQFTQSLMLFVRLTCHFFQASKLPLYRFHFFFSINSHKHNLEIVIHLI